MGLQGAGAELIKKGIRVNGIAPGPVWTPLVPSSFPEDMVRTLQLKISYAMMYDQAVKQNMRHSVLRVMTCHKKSCCCFGDWVFQGMRHKPLVL